jgi:hypothetical protein
MAGGKAIINLDTNAFVKSSGNSSMMLDKNACMTASGEDQLRGMAMHTRGTRQLGGHHEPRERSSIAAGPLHRHTGTMASTGGPFWVLPLIFLSLPILSLAQAGFNAGPLGLYAILAGIGLLSLAWVAAAKLQAVELYADHFVHRKWGLRRRVQYADVTRAYSELKSASQSYHSSMVPRQGMTLWSTPRTMHVELASGGEVELVEMTEHPLLERRLNDFAESFAGRRSS